MIGDVETEYSEVHIEEIINYFVAGYKPNGKGKKISGHEYNYDPHQGKVIIKLYVVDDEKK